MIKDDFACEKAQMVTRRAGPDIACASENASERCKKLLEAFKQVGLPAFDAKDDLLKTPHSVFAKIQFGGLLGLAADINNGSKPQDVENIFGLVENALQKFDSIDKIPSQEFVDEMLNYKIKRKKTR